MAPTWPRYYDRAAAVLFVVDAAVPETWAEALVLLTELVGAVQEKPIGVVLNKLDAAAADGGAARGLLGLEVLDFLADRRHRLNWKALVGAGAAPAHGPEERRLAGAFRADDEHRAHRVRIDF